MPKKLIISKREVPKNNSPKKTKSVLSKSNFVKKPVQVVQRFDSAQKKSDSAGTDGILVENFIGLQKVLVNLTIKLDGLANQISQLLNLFEISARSLAERGGDIGGGYDKRIMEKIDNIIDQNKTLARGIALLHEPGQAMPSAPLQSSTAKPQQFSLQPPGQEQTSGFEPIKDFGSYQKSISSKQQFNKLPQG